MSSSAKYIVRMLICLTPFLLASCLGMSVPKDAKLEPPLASAGNPGFSGPSVIDRALVDKWELTHRVNDKGEENLPEEGIRTLIEFTDGGEVIFNRNDKESASLKSRKGRYSAAKSELVVTDDQGTTSRWPYQVTGDMMVFTMPEKAQKFYWRRYR
jgi:hypothetical protein